MVTRGASTVNVLLLVVTVHSVGPYELIKLRPHAQNSMSANGHASPPTATSLNEAYPLSCSKLSPDGVISVVVVLPLVAVSVRSVPVGHSARVAPEERVWKMSDTVASNATL